MAKTRPSANPFRLVAASWAYARKHPVLFDVLLWMIVLPAAAGALMNGYWPEGETVSMQQIATLGYVLGQVLVAFVTFWGSCAVLLVGRRMIRNRAGRNRTSFKAVRRESLGLILPLFFTGLLRSFVTFYWSLLYLIPAGAFVFFSVTCHTSILSGAQPLLDALNVGDPVAAQAILSHVLRACGVVLFLLPLLLPALLYNLRTVFFPIALAAEDFTYRAALRRSRQALRGRFWRTMGVLFLLTIVIFVPSNVLVSLLDLVPVSLPWLDAVRIVLESSIQSIALFLFVLASILVYGGLIDVKKKGPQEVVPEEVMA